MWSQYPANPDARLKATNGPPGLQGIARDGVRLAFIRKVYAIVTAQILTTLLVSILFVYGPLGKSALRLALLRPNLMMWGSFLTTSSVLFALSMAKRTHPINLYLLGAFTLLTSFSVSIVCTVYATAGYGTLIMQAAAITAFMLGGLTVYAFNSKQDFSFWSASLFPTLSAMVFWGLISYFFPSLQTGFLGLVFSFLAAMMFCGYIILDTFLISNHLPVDDYVEGAIQLYLDVINLFLNILDILVDMVKQRE